MENDFEDREEAMDDEEEVVETEATPAPVDEAWEDVDDFIGGDYSPAAYDPDKSVTIRTSSGGDKIVPVEGPTALSEVIAKSGLFIGGAVEYYMNGATIRPDSVVPGGSTVTVIGSVKGG